MPGFATYDAIINAITNLGQSDEGFLSKSDRNLQTGAPSWVRTYVSPGIPGAGAEPAATPGTAYTSDGSTVNFANVSTKQRYLLNATVAASLSDFSGASAGTVMIYDRLVGVGGISVSTTGNKTINSTALGRYTSGAQVQCWLEVTTATSTTAPVVHLNAYTNDGGTAGRAGANFTFPSTTTQVDSALGPLPLQAGDLGVRSIQVGLNVGTASASGVINVMLIRPLVYVPFQANGANDKEQVTAFGRMPQVFDGASLSYYWLPFGGQSRLFVQLRTAYG